MSQPALNKSQKPQILICDDNISFSLELIEVLRDRGFPATALLTVSAIRAAILGPSILILDLCMPKVSGTDIINMLALHARRDHFKIVLVSGSDEETLLKAAALCEEKGLHLLGTFRKPILVKPLCELLEAAVP